MATLAPGGRISLAVVEEEIERLRQAWQSMKGTANAEEINELERFFSREEFARLDLFDRLQLANVLQICREANTLSEAGRKLFSTSRIRKTTTNDADRLRKYLARFGLDWRQLRSSENH
jgi:transcriptional regulatory protein RtcR